MNARNQYLKVLQAKYFMAISRKEKSSILDEYCGNTGQNRKYVIRKLSSSISLVPKRRGGKQIVYDGHVKAALAKLWEIFDYPCGQRLAPLLKTEVDRLRQLEESEVPNEVRDLGEGVSPNQIHSVVCCWLLSVFTRSPTLASSLVRILASQSRAGNP